MDRSRRLFGVRKNPENLPEIFSSFFCHFFWGGGSLRLHEPLVRLKIILYLYLYCITYIIYRITYTVFGVLPIPYYLYRITYTVLSIPYYLYRITYTILPIPYYLYRITYTVLSMPYYLYLSIHVRYLYRNTYTWYLYMYRYLNLYRITHNVIGTVSISIHV